MKCKCGSNYFLETVSCKGKWITLIDEHGNVEDTNLNGLKYGLTPKTVVCADCGKRNKNPLYNKE